MTFAALAIASAPPARAQQQAPAVPPTALPPTVPPSAAGPATAGQTDAADACFGAAERAQPLLRQKKLREARALLEFCSRDACPRVARTDCREWLAEATDAQPSILIAPHEVYGKGAARDVAGVRATIDETLVVDHVDVTPVVIDPGRHRLRLERAGAPPLVIEVDIHDGEKGRVIDAYWREPEVVGARPVPAGVYVSGALGVFALGVGAYFEASGLSDRRDLDRCKPSCPQSQVNNARTQTAVGDAALGGGALLLAGALVLYLTRPTADSEAGEHRANQGAAWLLGPAPGGFFAGVRGSL